MVKILPEKFKERMKDHLGEDYSNFLKSYDEPPVRGLRINTLKISKAEFLKLSPWETEQNPLLDEGLILKENAEHIGTHPFHLAGLFYMQEPSAMSVIEAADILPGMKVLDVCAAPGGKSTGIAARLKGSGLLVSNEIVPSRAKLLAGNIERIGAVNSVVTSVRPDLLSNTLPRFFDRVLVDAPCSGEGMFRKDPQAVSEWSEENVLLCAKRQSAIIESAAECLKSGGKLIYSTCTFSENENEDIVNGFLKRHDDFSLDFMKRLYPHKIRGEGHFVARLSKKENPDCKGSEKFPFFRLCVDKKALSAAENGLKQIYSDISPFQDRMHITKNGNIHFMPFDMPDVISKLKILSCGVDIGSVSNGIFKPSHSLFMSACGAPYKETVEIGNDDKAVRKFLSGNTLEINENLKGFLPVTVNGYTIGFGKAVGGILKNHLPKGLQIPSYR